MVVCLCLRLLPLVPLQTTGAPSIARVAYQRTKLGASFEGKSEHSYDLTFSC